jgi:hypothetical protein
MKTISNTSVIPKKLTLKDQGNIKIEALNEIIVNKKGKPDLLAIDIYSEARAWFKPKKTKVNGNIIYSSKLKGYGWQIGYEYFVKKYKCSDDVIRKKLVLLENLGLLTRDFRTEYFYGKRFNNLMYLLVWKDTPYFYSEIGLEKPKKLSIGYPEKQGLLSANSRTPILENKDNIYVIPNDHPKEDKNSNKSFLSSKNIILKQEINNIITRARDPLQKNEENRDAPSAFSSPAEQAQAAKLVPKELACLFAPPIFPVNNLSNKTELPSANNNEIYEKVTMDEKATLTASDRKMLLSKALLSAFGKEDADLLQDDCEFIELEADKVKITIGSKKSLSDLEKEKIRKSLKSVYGEEVRIVTGKRETQVESVTNCSRLTQENPPESVTNCDKLSLLPTPELLTNVRANNSEWFRFRQNLIRVLTKRHEEKIAQHIVKNWFDKLGVSELSNSQKLVMIADPFYIHWIENNYDHVVEEAVCLGNFIVELHYKGNQERPRIYSKESIRGKKW